jgi:hypothetical protein
MGNINMKDITTIKLIKEVKSELDELKIIPEETYNGVIVRLISYYKQNLSKEEEFEND